MIDIGFIFGVLGFDSLEYFQWQLDFASRLLVSYTVSMDAVLPGAVVYGVENPKVDIRFGDVVTKDAARRRFASLPVPTTEDMQFRILSERIKSLFSFKNGARAGAKRTMVFFFDTRLDSQSYRNFANLFQTLFEAEVKIILIGVGGADLKQLRTICIQYGGVGFYANSLFELSGLMAQVVGASTTGWFVIFSGRIFYCY